MMDPRLSALSLWLQDYFSTEIILQPITNDASFRRYFRLQQPTKNYIVMDAPPPQEDCHPFVAIDHLFAAQGLHVPSIYAQDLQQGFLLLEDFGDRQFAHELLERPNQLYQQALTTLLQLQRCCDKEKILPLYDANFLQQELNLLQPWFLERHLGLSLTAQQQQLLQALFQQLLDNALQQPQVCVHRDYHSRNLMLLNQDALGILDFQGAVIGPITYDAVSLLRDCYIAWPTHQVTQWVSYYLQQLQQQQQLVDITTAQFMRWFDLMGLQRHLKVLGIFTRLYYRDNKDLYLTDLPRVLNYVVEVSNRYSELAAFATWFSSFSLS